MENGTFGSRTGFAVIAATLAFAGTSFGQVLIEKAGPCPTLTRYLPPENWTTFPIEPAPTSLYPVGTVQNPLSPSESINCTQVPEGLKTQIVASELTPGPAPAIAYLMHFTFDERGRVWAVDARDYPYTHYNADGITPRGTPATYPSNRLTGQSRIVVLEDANGDGALDSYKVFYTGLAGPTSIEVVKGGVIVSVPPFVYYIAKSTTNPDTGTTPQVVLSGMGTAGTSYDTHGQINSLTRGLDNYIYGHLGYNNGVSGRIRLENGDSLTGVSVGTGNIWRFKSVLIGSETSVFQVHNAAGPSNAHGIGQMEDGQWFKSGATGTPHSNHAVRHGTNTQNSILSGTNNNDYWPITQDRYLWEGSTTNQNTNGYYTGSSAASGHDFYTARLLPQKYWNRFAFVCEGASKLCNQDSLVENGATWRAVRMPGPARSNIFASTDAWTAPLKVRTGPDGGLWVNDWYNYLFLHNPASPSTNSAWNNALRAKSRTRLYRIIPASGTTDPVLNLTNASNAQLVSTLYHTNFVWRMQAQRLLIERGYSEEIGNLLDSVLTKHRSVDAVGIDGPVLHALWTLHGMNRFVLDAARWDSKLRTLLRHPAWTVRRNAVLAMPPTAASYESIREMCAVNDEHAHVRVQALGELTRMPASGALIESMDQLRSDTHITSAYTAAGTSKVTTVAGSTRPPSCPAYLDTSSYHAGNPVGIRESYALRANKQVRFNLGRQGFDLAAAADLPSGELTVSDLRGRTVFRSTWNRATQTWSRASARNLPHPFYFYAFRGVNGQSFSGRLAMETGI